MSSIIPTNANLHLIISCNSDNLSKPQLNSQSKLKFIRCVKHSNRNNINGVYSTLPTNRSTYEHTFSSIYNASIPNYSGEPKQKQNQLVKKIEEHNVSINQILNHSKLNKEDKEHNQKTRQNKPTDQIINAYIKLKAKEEKVNKAKEQLKSIQKKEKETIRKRNELRQIRLKVHQLVSNCQSVVCQSFEAKNASYNFATIDFTTSNFYKKRDKVYHSVFRFDKNSYGEAHERFDMMIDLDEIKRYQKTLDDLLKEQLTTREKEYIKNDPAYFFNNNTLNEGNTKILKIKTLMSKLNEEEETELINKRGPFKRPVPKIASSTLELTKFLNEDPIVKKKKASRLKQIGPSELDMKKEESIKAINHQSHRLFTTEMNYKKGLYDADFVQREIEKMENRINLSKKHVILNRISIDAIKNVIKKKDYNPKFDRMQKEYNENANDNKKNNEANVYNYVALDKQDADELKEQLGMIKGAYKKKGGQRASIIFINTD